MSTTPGPVGGVNTGPPDAINVAMWQLIMHELHINPQRLSTLIQNYLIRAYGNNLPPELSSERGKAFDEIMNPNAISWKVFIKALAYINILQVDIELVLTFRDELIRNTVLPDGELVLRTVIKLDGGFIGRLRSGEEPHLGTYLADMFKSAQETLQIDRNTFDKLMVRYIEFTRTPVGVRKLATVKGNFSKEFTADTMTWSVFVKSLVFLGVESFTYSLALTNIAGFTSFHQKKVSL